MKLMDIEKLLQWAYRDELTKGGPAPHSPWEPILSYGERGGMAIDDQIGPAMKLPPIFGEPHPDALTLGRLVRQIGDVVIDWSASARGLLDEASTIDNPLERREDVNHVTYDSRSRHASVTRDTRVFNGLRTQTLMVMHAKMGTRPDWRSEPIKVHGIKVQGGAYKLVGKATGSRRGRVWYSEGSYCPLEFTPRPETVALARAEYWAWWRGLVELSRLARGQLNDYEALQPAAPPYPWREIVRAKELDPV